MTKEELKDKYDTCLRENTGLKIHNAYVEKKLEEAKNIIKKMINTCCSYGATGRITAEAENFIKEE